VKLRLRMPTRRIGWRIFLPFAVLFVALSVLFSVIGLQFAEKTIRSNAANELRILSIVLSRQVQRQLSRVEVSLDSMENHGFLVQELRAGEPNKAAIEDFLQKRLKMLPLFEDLAVFNRAGLCVGATSPTWYELSGRQQPFFINALKNGFNFSDIFTSNEGKIQLVSTPVTNGTVAKGVLVGQVNMSSIYDLMDQKLGVSESTDAFLVDSALRFITPGKTGIDRLLESHLAAPLLKHLNNQDFWVDQYKNFSGQEVLGTVLKIPGHRWYVVVERDMAEITRPMSSAKELIVLGSLALIFVLMLVTYGMTRSITRPLLLLVEGAQRLAKGDFKSPFAIPKGLDEVAFLAGEFEKMRAQIAAAQEDMLEKLEESERRRLDNERLAAIGTLASTLAHEIRNPLNAMSLLLSRLELGKATAPSREGAIRDLRGEIARLDRLVSDILDYARPLVLNDQTIDLNELISTTLELYKGVFERKQVRYQLDLPKDALVIRGDPDRLKQCLVNLLQNAFEAVAADGHIKVSGERGPDGAVHIYIRDDGPGLPAQPEGRLFDLFFTTKETGTGLGLSTVKKIVDAHGGHISLESRSDGEDGTTIRGAQAHILLPPPSPFPLFS